MSSKRRVRRRDQHGRPPAVRLAQGATIEDVLDGIDQVIDWSIASASSVGYFAALYKRTTLAIRGAIDDGRFPDSARMQRFDVTFARRYFDAINEFFDAPAYGRAPKVWQVAYDENRKGTLIILQRLLTAMNAHIDLDLGVATAAVGGNGLKSLHNDFTAVNTILASQVDGVLDAIEKVSPALADYRDYFMDNDFGIISAAIQQSRASAWKFACQLAGKPKSVQRRKVRDRDAMCAMLGKWYLRPIPFVDLVSDIGAKESRDVAHNIEVLNEVAATPAALPRKLW
ncbi:MAG: hypothetical protein JO280_11910 [Mycobacteriaceae bacterium]|nr:hypothetical protein [Mycobacteriaceae bacterium]